MSIGMASGRLSSLWSINQFCRYAALLANKTTLLVSVFGHSRKSMGNSNNGPVMQDFNDPSIAM